MVNVIMHGCNGHMGQVITALAAEDQDIQIVAGVDITGVQKNDYPVFSNIGECTVAADVIIDFSSAKAADALLAYCTEKKVPVVLCTTGLSDEQLEKVKEAEKAETKAASKGGIHGRLEKAKVEIKAKEAEKVPKNKSKDLATAL